MHYYIYMLYSASCDKFYTGYSSDPWRRLEQHLENDAFKFTGKTKDWELKAVFRVSASKTKSPCLSRSLPSL